MIERNRRYGYASVGVLSRFQTDGFWGVRSPLLGAVALWATDKREFQPYEASGFYKTTVFSCCGPMNRRVLFATTVFSCCGPMNRRVFIRDNGFQLRDCRQSTEELWAYKSSGFYRDNGFQPWDCRQLTEELWAYESSGFFSRQRFSAMWL